VSLPFGNNFRQTTGNKRTDLFARRIYVGDLLMNAEIPNRLRRLTNRFVSWCGYMPQVTPPRPVGYGITLERLVVRFRSSHTYFQAANLRSWFCAQRLRMRAIRALRSARVNFHSNGCAILSK